MGLFGTYDSEFDGEPPETFDSNIPVPHWRLPHGNYGACGKVDVTRGPSDPSHPDFTGILDYTTMSLEQAMRIYWLAKGITVNGSASFNSSANGNGDYKRYSQRRVQNEEGGYVHPPEYEIYISYQWNGGVNVGSQTGSGNFSMLGQSGPYEPYERVCAEKFYKSAHEMPLIGEGDGDIFPERAVRTISCGAGGSVSKIVRLSDYGYGNDKPEIYVCCPTPPSAFYDNGEFKGYGFVQSLVSIDCRVSASADIVRPFMAIPLDPNRSRYINLSGGGQMYLSNVSYAGEDIHGSGLIDLYGTETTNRVNFMGQEMLFTIQGGEYGKGDNGNCKVETSGTGIKISYSEEDEDTLEGDADRRNSEGVGTVFTGGGNVSASASLEININGPEFYDYPEFGGN